MIHSRYSYYASFYPNLVKLVKKLDVPAMRKGLQQGNKRAGGAKYNNDKNYCDRKQFVIT